jgi:ribonucleoside-triphosphate reductase (thioredoxin)
VLGPTRKRAVVPTCRATEEKTCSFLGENGSEITLDGREGGEMCNLVEVFLPKIDDLPDFFRTLEFAYLYAKTVTLGTSSCELTNRNMLRNRRLGISITGIQQFVAKWGIPVLRQWCDEGYKFIGKCDVKYSHWLCIPESIKKTCIKPSGSLSLLVGVTAGIHYPESRFCIRRITLDKNSKLIRPLQDAGYNIEPSAYDDRSFVVSIPKDYGENVRTLDEVSMWEQFEMTALLQEYWSDNQNSITITFRPEEAKDIPKALEMFQHRIKCVSLLPRLPNGAYKQMPYEKITEEQYKEMCRNLQPVNWNLADTEEDDALRENFCDGASCSMIFKKKAVAEEEKKE